MTIVEALRLGMQHQQAGRLEQAESVYHSVLAADSRNADALHMLGIIAQQRGRHEEAIAVLRRAIELEPDAAEFWHNLGNSLLHLKRNEQAIEAFTTAARLNPKFFEPHHNLGATLVMQGRSNEAAEALRMAVELNPKSAEAHNNYGLALKDHGDVSAAIEQFERATELRSAYHHAHSNRLYAMHFDPTRDAKAIHTAHLVWAQRYAQPLAPSVPLTIDRSPDRRLRIGYVSPDFRDHPVGRSMLPLVEHFDRAQFEAVCYSGTASEDAVAQRLRAGATEWHDSRRLTDAQLAEQIREQRIDILVDLTLHMNRNRLLAFARKPAPVQATFIGYPATTGLRQMDYRITDRFLDPPGETEAVNSEQLIRLPNSFWCYVPDEDGPTVNERTGDAITFGSLNNPCKINEQVIDLWAAILRAAPDSTLLLYVIERNNVGERFRRLFAQREIDPARLSFISREPRNDYLRQYHQIDIVLDPFPYNGHMTSCDALWMGVPVVSLRGDTSVGRGGESLLANLGLTELLAHSPQQYVHIASALASDTRRLRELRRSLRQLMRASPLMDQKSFARDVYGCFRTMWREFTSRA